jgi:hypothetical protein
VRFIVKAAVIATVACGSKEPAQTSQRASDPTESATVPATVHAIAAPDAADLTPETSAVRSGHRCSEDLARVLSDIARTSGLVDGEVEDRSSNDVVEIAYFIDDADLRLPQLAIRIERELSPPPAPEPTGKPSRDEKRWQVVPHAPDWFRALAPSNSTMPISWPKDHLEQSSGGLRGSIVRVTMSTKVDSALERAARACVHAVMAAMMRPPHTR